MPTQDPQGFTCDSVGDVGHFEANMRLPLAILWACNLDYMGEWNT